MLILREKKSWTGRFLHEQMGEVISYVGRADQRLADAQSLAGLSALLAHRPTGPWLGMVVFGNLWAVVHAPSWPDMFSPSSFLLLTLRTLLKNARRYRSAGRQPSCSTNHDGLLDTVYLHMALCVPVDWVIVSLCLRSLKFWKDGGRRTTTTMQGN